MLKTDTAKVTEIINPLTVKLEDGRLVHLAGLDYPDLDFYDPGDISVAAVEILTDFLKGKHVRLFQTRDKEKGRVNRMGHHIAHLRRTDNNVWVQGLLLSLGAARVRTTFYNPEMAEQMLALENIARKENSGLWEIDEFKILTPETAAEHLGSYQVVEGVVKKVSMQKSHLYLNFGNNWREDFTISIAKSDLRQFNKQQLNPQQWNNKTLRVRGWIESYNGPLIRVDHPEQIEIVKTNAPPPEQPEKPAEETVNKPGSALPALNQ